MSTDGTTLYIHAFGVLAELVAPGTSGARWNDYLAVGNVKVGVRFTDVTPQTVTTRYYHTDHLGSVAVITSEAGAVVERLSYDAWGKRRHPLFEFERVRTQNRFPLLLNALAAPTIRPAPSRA